MFLRTVNPNLSEAYRQTRMAFRFRITTQQISSARFAARCSNGRREFEHTILWLEKVPGRIHHDRSLGQLLVIRHPIREKHLGSHNLCDDHAHQNRGLSPFIPSPFSTIKDNGVSLSQAESDDVFEPVAADAERGSRRIGISDSRSHRIALAIWLIFGRLSVAKRI